jgi:hypothetical protein
LGNKRHAIHPAGFLAVPVGHDLFWSTARNPSLLIVLITARSATTLGRIDIQRNQIMAAAR